ncbi:MAG: hypothetical protein SGI77_14950 [Pirellulaceae bacterium]|nr:hypothetical protein [Pirellulaceae bacterium]
MKFNEDSRVKIPAILHLMPLGYEDGSEQPQITRANLEGLKAICPDMSVGAKLNEACTPGRLLRQLLVQQNQELTELRDWLLPMLMNGQVTVV